MYYQKLDDFLLQRTSTKMAAKDTFNYVLIIKNFKSSRKALLMRDQKHQYRTSMYRVFIHLGATAWRQILFLVRPSKRIGKINFGRSLNECFDVVDP